MTLPRICITDANGNELSIESLPEPIKNAIFSKIAEHIKHNEPLEEPDANEKIALGEALERYMNDPRPREDRGPSPLDEKLRGILKELVLLRSFHREMIISMAKNELVSLDSLEQKMSMASWVRDEAIFNAAIEILEGALD